MGNLFGSQPRRVMSFQSDLPVGINSCPVLTPGGIVLNLRRGWQAIDDFNFGRFQEPFAQLCTGRAQIWIPREDVGLLRKSLTTTNANTGTHRKSA